MVLCKKLTKHEVLEALTKLMIGSLPEGFKGDVSLCYTDEGDVEVYLYPEPEEHELN